MSTNRKTRRKAAGKLTENLQNLKDQIAAESGRESTVPTPWKRLAKLSDFLRPGTLTVVGGQTGKGKSYFALQIIQAAVSANLACSYIPFEEDRVHYCRRMAALCTRSFEPIDSKEAATEAIDRHADEMHPLSAAVLENPYRTLSAKGGLLPPAPDYREILRLIDDRLRQQRVVVVDPLASIDFGRNKFNNQGDFIRQLTAIASRHQGTIVLIVHTVKEAKREDLGVKHLQGSADISRHAQSVLLIEDCDGEAFVLRKDGELENVAFNRLLKIAKARHGKGTNRKIAFVFGEDGPVFDERGIVATASEIMQHQLAQMDKEEAAANTEEERESAIGEAASTSETVGAISTP